MFSWTLSKSGAEGGSRTHTKLPSTVFETAASTIPPLRQPTGNIAEISLVWA